MCYLHWSTRQKTVPEISEHKESSLIYGVPQTYTYIRHCKSDRMNGNSLLDRKVVGENEFARYIKQLGADERGLLKEWLPSCLFKVSICLKNQESSQKNSKYANDDRSVTFHCKVKNRTYNRGSIMRTVDYPNHRR